VTLLPSLRNSASIKGMALNNAERQARWRAKRNRLAKEAAAMQKTRGRRGRRARPVDDANAFIGEAYDFFLDYSQRLDAWRGLAKFSEEDRAELVHALHKVANELSMIAQDLAGFTSKD